MASFVAEGIDDLVKTLQGADLFDEATQTELLLVGAAHLSGIISEEAGRATYQLKWVPSKLSKSRKAKKDKKTRIIFS